eukprot:2136518-Lingulodinium_polyedra.AAC.1
MANAPSGSTTWSPEESLLTAVAPLAMARPCSAGKTDAYWAIALGCCGRHADDSLTLSCITGIVLDAHRWGPGR